MTTSDFLSDPYAQISYPWEYEILKDWLVQYFQFLKTSPEVIRTMKQQSQEFEMVPIPKSLSLRLKQLPMDMPMAAGSASSFFGDPFSKPTLDFDPTPTDQLREKISVGKKLKSYPIIADLMRSFVRAIEKGDVENLLEVISDDYADDLGRDKPELEKAFEKIMNSSSGRKVILVNAEKFDYVDEMIVAKTTGSWEAMFDDTEIKSSDFFSLELIFSQNKNGDWKIISIKHMAD